MDQLEGFLDKLSPKARAGKGWQKRWFELSGGSLHYFKTKSARVMFQEMDADRSGALDANEVTELCKQMGLKKMKLETVEATMAQMDSGGDGRVTFPEFDAWWCAHGGKKAAERKPLKAIGRPSMASQWGHWGFIGP